MQNIGNNLSSEKSQYSSHSVAINNEALSRNIMRSAMNAPYLEKQEELDLILRWKNDNDNRALHKITQAHMRLVISIATKFKRYALPMSDLVQEGCVGLLEAAARFDPNRGVRFSTYATWWIRASIQDYILRNWSIVRGGTSSAQKSLFFNLRRLRAQLSSENQKITREEIYSKISEKIGVSINDVEMMDSRFSSNDNSLSSPISQDEESNVSKMDLLVDNNPLQDELIGDDIDNERRSVWIKKALHVLNERELQIINKRRLNDDGVTLESLGTILGISKERVRQIEARAIQKLRVELLSYNEMAAYNL